MAAYVSAAVGSGNAAAGTVATTTASWVVTAGNHIVVGVRWGNAAASTISNITDSAGNTYTEKVAKLTHSGNSDVITVWAAENISGHAANVVTVTFSDANPQFRVVAALQHSGVLTSSSFDTSATGEALLGAGTTVTSGSFTTTQADEVIAAFASVAAIGDTWSGSGGGAVIRIQDSDSICAFQSEIVAATQTGATRTLTATGTTDEKLIIVATFKAATASVAPRYVISRALGVRRL